MTTPKLLSNRYELGETLGYGGMSEVHKGRDVRLSRDVAIKVLRADLARDPQFQMRFRKEAQNAAALNHPAIVAVYDTGETQSDFGPLPYIVMEFVDGRTLRDIVKTEGPLDPAHAIEVMADASAALDFSHRHGIIHRDVKPANIMITRTGAVKVMDFGIARALADGQNMTQTAAVIGTAQYLSPEQARGEAVDARSDVYAAGCVLFELLTGQPPFTGDSPVAVAYQHVREDPPAPSDVNPTVPAALDAVVLKAMSKNPVNRYQSAAEMRADLVRVLSGQRPAAPMVMTDEDRTSLMGSETAAPLVGRPVDDYEDQYPSERAKRGRPWFAVLVTLLLAGILGLGAYLFWPTSQPTLRMKDYRGQPEVAAEQAIRKDGFTVKKAPIASKPEQVGTVMETSPTAGQPVTPGQEITIRIGAGPEQVEVPGLLGMSPTEAAAALKKLGLDLAPVTESEPVSNKEQIGKVIKQTPDGGEKVARGTTVSVTTGRAEDTTTIIDATGQPFDRVKANLESLGFKVERKDVESEEERNTVVRQSPAAGTKAKTGSTVTLEVSKGRSQTTPPDVARMPDLRGMSESEARDRLRDIGFAGQLVTQQRPTLNNLEDKKVVDTNPNAGSALRRDQLVVLLIGRLTLDPTGPGEGGR